MVEDRTSITAVSCEFVGPQNASFSSRLALKREAKHQHEKARQPNAPEPELLVVEGPAKSDSLPVRGAGYVCSPFGSLQGKGEQRKFDTLSIHTASHEEVFPYRRSFTTPIPLLLSMQCATKSYVICIAEGNRGKYGGLIKSSTHPCSRQLYGGRILLQRQAQ
jgi:hypothetical protein